MSRHFIFWLPVSIWKLFHMYFHQWPNLSVLLWWTKGAPFVTPFAHIFSSGSFCNTLNVDDIFLQKIISAIITIYSIASNEEFCITIIQLLEVWIALVSSWLIVQVNFITFIRLSPWKLIQDKLILWSFTDDETWVLKLTALGYYLWIVK